MRNFHEVHGIRARAKLAIEQIRGLFDAANDWNLQHPGDEIAFGLVEQRRLCERLEAVVAECDKVLFSHYNPPSAGPDKPDDPADWWKKG